MTNPTIDWHTGMPLAKGGNAEVVKVFSPSLERHIAVKYLLEESSAGIERMLREARTQARLAHPNIVAIHDTGTHLGRHYIAMDYVDGASLDAALSHCDTETKLKVFLQVLAGMGFAHDQGVVHRDLKPANVLVAEESQELVARIADFGLARQPEDATLTVTGHAIGTPGYMSPEQARGEKDVTPASDVFSLGVMLYQLLTGKLPFDAETPMALMLAAASADTLPIHVIRQQLPDGLARIVIYCLENHPENRYPDANALCTDIKAFLQGDPLDAQALDRRYRLKRWARANPGLAGLSAVLAGVLLVAGSSGIYITQHNAAALDQAGALITQTERARAEWTIDQMRPVHDQRAAIEKATRVLDGLTDASSNLPAPAAAQVDAAMADLQYAIGNIDAAKRAADRAFGRGLRTPEVAERATLSALRQFDSQRFQVSLTSPPDRASERIDTLRSQLQQTLKPYQPYWRTELAALVQGIQDDAISEPLAQPFLGDPSDPVSWDWLTLVHQAQVAHLGEQLNVNKSETQAKLPAITASLRALTETARSYLPAYNTLCQLAILRLEFVVDATTVNPEEALTDCNTGLIIRPDSVRTLASKSHWLWRLARIKIRAGLPVEDLIAQSIDIAEQALDLDEDNLTALLSLGTAYELRARAQLTNGQDGNASLEKAVFWQEKAHAFYPQDINIMNNLAITYSWKANQAIANGKEADAIQASRDSYNWIKRAAALKPDDRRLAHNVLSAKSNILFSEQKLGRDIRDESEALIAALNALIEKHPDYLTPLNTLGLSWWNLAEYLKRNKGDYQPALDAAASAFEAALQLQPDYENAKVNLASIYRASYVYAEREPEARIAAMANQSLSLYDEVEDPTAELSEFNCYRAEILLARSQWEDDKNRQLSLWNDVFIMSDPDANFGWSGMDCVSVQLRLGTTLALRDLQPERVQLLWEKALAWMPKYQDMAELLATAAEFARSLGHDEKARQWQRSAHELNPDFPAWESL